MKKSFIIIIIFVVTITLGFIELNFVRNTLTTMENTIIDLNRQYALNESDITIFYDDIGDLKEYWEQKENWLCFLFNHRDLSLITDSINKLISYTKNNDYDNAISELAVLQEYSTKGYHIMGFNIHNIL